jgi:hypothetical protein
MNGLCARILSNGTRCNHPFEEHASDLNTPDAMRCWHGAATGDGCTVKYDERCPDYVSPA